MEVVREKVAQSYDTLLDVYTVQMKQSLKQVVKYMSLAKSKEADIMRFLTYKEGSIKKGVAITGILDSFNKDSVYFDNVDSFFVYKVLDQDLIMDTSQTPLLTYNFMKNNINSLIREMDNENILGWKLVKIGDKYRLINMINIRRGGYVGAVVQVDNLLSSLRELELGEEGGVVFLSNMGEFVGENNMPFQLVNQVKGLNLTENYSLINNNGLQTKYLLINKPLETIGLKILVLIPEKMLLKNLPVFQVIIYMLPVLGIILIVLYFTLLRNVLIEPMLKLISGMREISGGNLNLRIAENYSFELNFLINSFNKMIEEIKGLKISLYEDELKIKESELKILQSQINPHFYLNSLNIISSLSLLKDFDSIRKMTLYLGNYFSYTIRNKDKLVNLVQEVKHIQNYLEIQKLRFPEKLEYSINTADNCDYIMLPPLTLQPLVENSLIHGFSKKGEKLIISVEAYIEGDRCTIKITDNGRGFPDNILDMFNNSDFCKTGEHIGVGNVFQRLEIHYKKGCRLKFYNNKGAVVEILLYKPQEKGRGVMNV